MIAKVLKGGSNAVVGHPIVTVVHCSGCWGPEGVAKWDGSATAATAVNTLGLSLSTLNISSSLPLVNCYIHVFGAVSQSALTPSTYSSLSSKIRHKQ
jgi:hypothetical protein